MSETHEHDTEFESDLESDQAQLQELIELRAIERVLSRLVYHIRNQEEVSQFVKGSLDRRHPGVLIALLHSELSEVLEACRRNNPPDEHCPEFHSVEIELAGTLIRLMGAAFELCRSPETFAQAVLAKMKFNASRPPKHDKRRSTVKIQEVIERECCDPGLDFVKIKRPKTAEQLTVCKHCGQLWVEERYYDGGEKTSVWARILELEYRTNPISPS